MLFDELREVDGSFVRQEEDDARNEEFVVSIVVLGDSQSEYP